MTQQEQQAADLRSTLQAVGLTQSGFARTLTSWGDPREPAVVLRWVQRAVAGMESVPYVAVVLRMLREHIDRRELLYRQLDLLESGKMRSGANYGTGWKDTTAEGLAETKRQIRELDKLLAECRLDPPVGSSRVQE